MSIQTEIDRINTSVTAAYAVLEGLGADMPAEENVDNLAATAASILPLPDVLPMSHGGTESSNGATGLANLLAAGATVLSSNQYGATLPAAGTRGRVFLKPTDGTELEPLDELREELVSYVDATVSNVPIFRPNLLDNSDFTNPVNQRGETSYTAKGYTIDRWYNYLDTANIQITDDGIVLSNTSSAMFNITQRFDTKCSAYMGGKTYTFAVCESDGTVFSVSGVVDANDVSANTAQFTKTNPDGRYYINFYKKTNGICEVRINVNAGKTASFKWAALYEGEFTEDTLPEYQPKGYGAELAECQRYQYVINGYASAAGVLTSSKGALILSLPTPVSMRAKPAVTGLTISGVRTVPGSNTTPTVTSFSVDSFTPHCVNLSVTTATFNTTAYTNNTPVFAYVRTAILDANL